jgi:hypothetical protein
VITAGHDESHPGVELDHVLGQGLHVLGIAADAIADLTPVVAPPAIDPTDMGQCASRVAPGGDPQHSVFQSNHVLGLELAGQRLAIAQLTSAIRAPAFDAVLCGQSAGVISARGYCRGDLFVG